MPNFSDAAVDDLFARVLAVPMNSGYFESVNGYEPKNMTGGSQLTAALWVQDMLPIRASGLASLSGLLVLSLRIYINFISQPFDAIDPSVLKAMNAMIGTYSGNFDFGGADGVRAIDLLASQGVPFRAQAGYVDIERKIYRVMTLTIPIIVNDMWIEAG